MQCSKKETKRRKNYPKLSANLQPRHVKTCLCGFRPIQTGLYSHRKWLRLDSLDLESRGNIYVSKTKALISCAVLTQLICAFIFVKRKNRFSHAATQ